MNKKDKLVEATVKALQGKLKLKENNEDIEDVTPKECYVEFGRRLREIIYSLDENEHIWIYRDFTRRANIITLIAPQSFIINRQDALNYILKRTKFPNFTERTEYNEYNIEILPFDDENSNYNKNLKDAEDYINNQFMPVLKEYMDSHYKECIPKIKEGLEHYGIIVRDIQAKQQTEKLFDSTIEELVSSICTFIESNEEYVPRRFPYDYEYIITIDINDNKELLENIKADIIDQKNRKKQREDQKVIRQQKEQERLQAYKAYLDDSSKDKERDTFLKLLLKTAQELDAEDYHLRFKDYDAYFQSDGLAIYYETEDDIDGYDMDDIYYKFETASKKIYKKLNMTEKIPAKVVMGDRSGGEPKTKKFILH